MNIWQMEMLARRGNAEFDDLLSAISMNNLYLGGQWNFMPEYAEAATGSKITYEYSAKKSVFCGGIGKSSGNKNKNHCGWQSSGAIAGSDVSADGTATITGDRLYNLLQNNSYGTHTIQIQIEGSGLDAYTFTFG